MESILEKINKLDRHFRSTSDQPDNLRFLQRVVKLSEEVGELAEAALTETDPDQRKKDREINFDAELADVVITALMLSTGRKANMTEEIHKKLDKVLTRFNISL